MVRIRSQLAGLITAIAVILPLGADPASITTRPLNVPAKVYAATVGSDSNLWILTDKGNLARLTPAGGYTEFPLQFGSTVFSIATGIDGNLWIPGPNGHVERVTTAGAVTDFAAGSNFFFYSPAVQGADGAVWFYWSQNQNTNASNAWKLGRIDMYGRFTTYDLNSDVGGSDFLRGFVSGGDGNLWFINETKNQLVKFSLVTKRIGGTYALPPATGSANQMTLGWDGNVWFTRATSVDRATPDGTVTEFRVPSGGKPAAILASGDGNIWFTEPSAGKIGQLVLSSVSGSSATINEGAFSPDAEQLFLNLPPAFASSAGVAGALRAVPYAGCPPTTRMGVDSRTGQPVLITEPAPPDCVTVEEAGMVGLFDPLGAAAIVFGGNVQQSSVDVDQFANAEPFAQPATVTAILNLSAAPGVAITGVSATDPAALVSFSALKASITSSKTVAARVSVSAPSGTQTGSLAGAFVLSSNVVDPDPRHRVVSFFLEPPPTRGVVLPSNQPGVVTTPVSHGK